MKSELDIMLGDYASATSRDFEFMARLTGSGAITKKLEISYLMRFLNTKEMASFMGRITKISQNITVSVGKYTMTIDISINLMANTQDVFMVISQIEMTRLRRL
ncbi:hypothetical protein [Campylobacter concisus]|uniref:hypothetical protein n=1 Tax=Campylobacter concisus TaxID=199 RepID=UPI000D30D043|nr:hypothetical protein [Campylobacter concisus]